VSVEEGDSLANGLGHVHAWEVAVEGTQVNLKHRIGVGLNTQTCTAQHHALVNSEYTSWNHNIMLGAVGRL
jgi:hypothetical protein